MTEFLRKLGNNIKPERQHILDANQMADDIFSREPALHLEMFEAIAKRLAANYEVGRNNFVNFKKPDTDEEKK